MTVYADLRRSGIRAANIAEEEEAVPNEQRTVAKSRKLRTLKRMYENRHHNDRVRVFVHYKNKYGKNHAERVGKKLHDFDEVNAIAVEVDKNTLTELVYDDEIDLIEEDELVSVSKVTVPYGIKMTQGGPNRKQTKTKVSGGSVAGDCSREGSFKVAIIDTGVHRGHRDLPCTLNEKNCIGKSFGTEPGEVWYEDKFKHGE